MMATFYASVPILPIYCQENGITGSKIGIVLTSMSIATVLFRPFAGYILDNFNRYHVYMLFLGLFCLPFLGFVIFPIYGIMILFRLYMGVVYSVCGSATTTLAGDVLPADQVGPGVNRFALTISLGMAAGPFIGIQVQNHMNSKTSFIVLFALTVLALLCVSFCKIQYPKVTRKKFVFADAFYKPSLPFMLNMMFFMVPFGAIIAYSSIFAQEKGLSAVTPYFYIFLVAGMLISKFSTQKMIDHGNHTILVILSSIFLLFTMGSYFFLESAVHFLLAGFLCGLGYGILQPLFQSFVTGTAPAHKRGTANATYLLSYDIGIGIGSFVMGLFQENIGLSAGFALTAIAYLIGGILYIVYTDSYYEKLLQEK